MEYISVSQFAEKFGISERTALHDCGGVKTKGEFLMGKTGNIPCDAVLPVRESSKFRISP